jgi:hypothetical protein
MKMKIRSANSIRFAARLFAALFILASQAHAGPPLICHQIDIGNAKSLLWVSHDWNLTGAESYNTKNLVRDTLAILDSNAPVLVRMETLRRATLYARKDPQTAKELLTKLYTRATAAEFAGHSDALAWFDAGYLAEAYKQWLNSPASDPAAGVDGYAWIKKAIALRGDDPQLQFAAALITLAGPLGDHRRYVENAESGAKSDPLLARNLSARFLGSQSPTIAEMFSGNSAIKKSSN